MQMFIEEDDNDTKQPSKRINISTFAPQRKDTVHGGSAGPRLLDLPTMSSSI